MHNGVLPDPDFERDVEDAITLAPQMVQQLVQGQMIIGIVAVPTCMKHMETREKSAAERATASGLILGG